MRRYICAAFVCAAAASSATAQNASGGLRFDFGLNTTLRADDNWMLDPTSAGTSYQFNNHVTAGLTSETRASLIQLNLGADLHVTDIAGVGQSSGLANPTASLSFRRDGVDSRLTVNAAAAQSDRNLLRSGDTGTQTDTSYGLSYAFGVGQPFGGSVSAARSTKAFKNTTDTDETNTSFDGQLSILATPKLTVSPRVAYNKLEEDDLNSTVTETTSAGVGISAEISDVTRIDADVSDKTIKVSTGSKVHGTAVNLSLTRQAQNGQHTFSVGRDLATTGTRTSINYSRRVELPDSQITWGIGATRASDDTDKLTAQLDYQRPLPSGQLQLALKRGFDTLTDGTESLLTDFSATLLYDLTDVSSIDVSATYSSEQKTAGTSKTDAAVSLAYNRKVTDDWMLRVGLQHRVSDDDTSPMARSNSIFVGLDRTWVAFR